MTYVELYHKAMHAFDPDNTGCIKGRPVMVLYYLGKLVGKTSLDEQVDMDQLREGLSADHLDAECVKVVLGLV